MSITLAFLRKKWVLWHIFVKINENIANKDNQQLFQVKKCSTTLYQGKNAKLESKKMEKYAFNNI